MSQQIPENEEVCQRFADLSYRDLSHKDLRGYDLTGANLNGAKLIETNLSGATLKLADFSHADLRLADLTHADLEGANFKRTNLSGANLKGAKIQETDFEYADIKLVKMDANVKLEENDYGWDNNNLFAILLALTLFIFGSSYIGYMPEQQKGVQGQCVQGKVCH